MAISRMPPSRGSRGRAIGNAITYTELGVQLGGLVRQNSCIRGSYLAKNGAQLGCTPASSRLVGVPTTFGLNLCRQDLLPGLGEEEVKNRFGFIIEVHQSCKLILYVS